MAIQAITTTDTGHTRHSNGWVNQLLALRTTSGQSQNFSYDKKTKDRRKSDRHAHTDKTHSIIQHNLTGMRLPPFVTTPSNKPRTLFSIDLFDPDYLSTLLGFCIEKDLVSEVELNKVLNEKDDLQLDVILERFLMVFKNETHKHQQKTITEIEEVLRQLNSSYAEQFHKQLRGLKATNWGNKICLANHLPRNNDFDETWGNNTKKVALRLLSNHMPSITTIGYDSVTPSYTTILFSLIKDLGRLCYKNSGYSLMELDCFSDCPNLNAFILTKDLSCLTRFIAFFQSYQAQQADDGEAKIEPLDQFLVAMEATFQTTPSEMVISEFIAIESYMNENITEFFDYMLFMLLEHHLKTALDNNKGDGVTDCEKLCQHIQTLPILSAASKFDGECHQYSSNRELGELDIISLSTKAEFDNLQYQASILMEEDVLEDEVIGLIPNQAGLDHLNNKTTCELWLAALFTISEAMYESKAD